VFRVWRRLLGLCDKTVLEDIEHDEDVGVVIAHVRPKSRWTRRCGRCYRRSSRFDNGDGRRRWRGLDLGTVQVFLEADAPRVLCRRHGVTVAAVPWARHGACHTRAFEDTVGWLATQCSKTAVTKLLRIGWRTVGNIITRVVADIDARVDRLEGLRRIGIDEISYKRGHKYLMVVVDHDTGRLVWAAPGRDAKALAGFFDALGEARCAQITHVSADSAEWIGRIVRKRCKDAVLCAESVPRRVLGHRRARRGPPRAVEPGPRRGQPPSRTDGDGTRPGTSQRCASARGQAHPQHRRFQPGSGTIPDSFGREVRVAPA
jgi:transposase